ncbi:MAG: DUF58 domain-containing protein [Gammaproteobacteria bacterium]|nr:DUF58 domain-containing protein [Gammaproteobacteria bacterium]
MNTITQHFNQAFGRKVQNWAHRRQGTDPRSCRLTSRRIYILPTRAGIIYAVVVSTMLLGSMNYNNNTGFALTFLLTGIGIISIYNCHRNLADIFLHFVGSRSVFAGESVHFNFIIENQNTYSRAQLLFCFDGHQEICDVLAAGDRQPMSVRVNSTRRGRLNLPRLLLATRYPLGLFRAWTWINMDVTEIIYPQPAATAPSTMMSHGGHSISARHSAGDEDFSGLRSYHVGDPPKRIAWKILAHTGETMITEYNDGSRDPVWVDWYDYPSSHPEERLSLLTRRALDADLAGHIWGLRMPGQVIGADRGAAHRHQCLRALALYDPGSGQLAP